MAVSVLTVSIAAKGYAQSDADDGSATRIVYESEYDRLTREAAESVVASDWGSAFRKLNQAMDLDPERPEAYFTYGRAHYLRGEYAAAERAFGELVEIDRDQSKVWFELARLMALKGELNEALKCAQKAIELSEPKEWRHFVLLGELYAEMELRESAVKAFDDAAALLHDRIDPLQRAITRVGEGVDVWDITQYPEIRADLYTGETKKIPSVQYHYQARNAPERWIQYLAFLKAELATVEARKTEVLAWMETG